MKQVREICVLLLCCAMLLVMGACGRENTKKENPESMTEQSGSTEKAKEKAHVIILAGQSNASGMSNVESLKRLTPVDQYTQYEKGYKNVQIYYFVDRQNRSYEFVPVALGQGSTDTRFGPEVGIAAYLSENYPEEKFYILKAAMGGSSLSMNWQESSDIYQDMVKAMGDGFSELVDKGLEPEWFATCWMQGETDSIDEAVARQYGTYEADLMKRLKSRFKQYASPKGISVIDAGISTFTGWPYREVINEAKKQYAAENPINFYFDTDSLTYDQDNDDYCHYDAVPMIELGRMFGERIQQAAILQEYVK